MDLMCWIDIEQFRRMLHKEKEKREEKSKDIKNKYLNKKYFFGPNSPATKEQQDQVSVYKTIFIHSCHSSGRSPADGHAPGCCGWVPHTGHKGFKLPESE